jgi:hypothetical protein
MSCSTLRFSAFCLSAALVLSSCGESKIDLTLLEQQRAGLKTELETSQKAIQKAKQIVTQLRQATDGGAALAAGAPEIDEAAEVNALKAEMAAYKAKYREQIRSKAPGMELANFNLKGRNFGTVKVKNVDDTWFIFQHSGGVTRILMRDVDQGLRDQFACEVPKDPEPIQVLVADVPPGAGGAAASAATGDPDPAGLASGGVAAADGGPAKYSDMVTNTPGVGAPTYNSSYITGGESVMGPDGSLIYVPPGGKMPKKGYTADGLKVEVVNGKTRILIGK